MFQLDPTVRFGVARRLVEARRLGCSFGDGDASLPSLLRARLHFVLERTYLLMTGRSKVVGYVESSFVKFNDFSAKFGKQ